jgi:cation diffusion facilitator family transporter
MIRDYRQIQIVLIITFGLNIAASAAKLGVGLWTGALSLVADGLDTLFDGISNIVGILAVRVSSRPPDKEHPYGHRKFETLAAMFIAAALFITAWELARGAVDRLLVPQPVIVNRFTIGALLFSGVIQSFTGIWELRKGRELHSEVLIADARHTLASIGVSIAVLAGLVLVWAGYLWVDPLVALLVAGVIAKIGVDTVRENVPALVDRAPLAEESIGQVVASVEGVASYHRIRSRGPEDNVAIDLHVRVAPNITMQDANAIADEVRRRLLALAGVGDVTVHVEAERTADSAADIYTTAKLAAQELGMALHECWVQSVDHQLSLHLHVGVDPTLTLSAAHDLVDQLEASLLERQTELTTVHTHIELANHEILPGSRVSNSLQKRVHLAIETAAGDISGLRHPHAIQVRQIEGKLFVSLEAWVDGALSMTEAHELSTQLQVAIRAAIPNISEALVHLEPYPSHSQETQERNVPIG